MTRPSDRETARELLNEWNRWASVQPCGDDAVSLAEMCDKENEKFVEMMASALAQARADSAAMNVVKACIALQSEQGECPFCPFERYPDDPRDKTQHGEMCPLVANGFITRDGKRIGAGP
jgi:hypothetical protein